MLGEKTIPLFNEMKMLLKSKEPKDIWDLKNTSRWCQINECHGVAVRWRLTSNWWSNWKNKLETPQFYMLNRNVGLTVPCFFELSWPQVWRKMMWKFPWRMETCSRFLAEEERMRWMVWQRGIVWSVTKTSFWGDFNCLVTYVWRGWKQKLNMECLPSQFLKTQTTRPVPATPLRFPYSGSNLQCPHTYWAAYQ